MQQSTLFIMNIFLLRHAKKKSTIYSQSFHAEVGTLKKGHASSGNRTRAARVAGEHSTTEPTMLSCAPKLKKYNKLNGEGIAS